MHGKGAKRGRASPARACLSSLLASLFQLALAICRGFNNSFWYRYRTDNSNTPVTASVAKWLSTARAAYTHAQTHYSSLNCAAIVDGRRGQLIVRTKSLARFFVVLRDARAGAACVDCCAGSGPRAPLLLRESTRIKGDKAGIRKQRPHTTVASPPSVRPRHVRRTS